MKTENGKRKTITLLLALLCVASTALALKETDLPNASALAGTEKLRGIQVGTGNDSVNISLAQLTTYLTGHGVVPSTLTINGLALSGNITLSKSNIGLGNVENTALSTWGGTSNLTTLGTISAGTWNAEPITLDYLANGGSVGGYGEADNAKFAMFNTDGSLAATAAFSVVDADVAYEARLFSDRLRVTVNDGNHAGTLRLANITTDCEWTMPNASGTVLLANGDGSSLTNLNAGAIASGTLAAARLPSFSGDVSSSGAAITLATVNSNVGTFTNATVTVNAKGLVTAASSGTAVTRASLGLATTDAVTFAGLTLTSGSQTTSTPFYSSTQTWNASGTTFVAERTNITNTASASGSAIRQWQVGGTTVTQIDKNGYIWGNNADPFTASIRCAPTGPTYSTGLGSGSYDQLSLIANGLQLVGLSNSNNEMLLGNSVSFGFASGSTPGNGGGGDLFLTRRGAGSLRLGKDLASPVAQTLGPGDAVGTNVAGVDFTLRASLGTGSAVSGKVIIKSGGAGSSGTTPNTLTTGIEVYGAGLIKLPNLPTSAAGLAAGTLWNNAGVLSVAP